MEANAMLKTGSFFNKVTENPWNNCAPRLFPSIKHDKHQLYSMLDYNQLKRFKKDFVMDILLKPALGETCLGSKRWREVYGRFCINPHEMTTQDDVKYIYECIHEMSPRGIITLLEHLKPFIIGEQNENYCPPTSNFLPLTGSQALSYHQGEPLFLKAQPNPPLHMNGNVTNLLNSNVHKQNTLGLKEDVKFRLYNSLNNSEIKFDDTGLFKQPINYPIISNGNLNRKCSKTSSTTKQQHLMRMCQPIKPQIPLRSTFEETQQLVTDRSNGAYPTFLQNHSFERLKLPDKIVKPRESASPFDLVNFEINENGDIVFLDIKSN